MRPSSLATALVAFSAGVTATLAARRLAARRPAATPAVVPVAAPVPAAVPAPGTDAVVLAFPRPVVVPAGPARCGDSGGLTKAGAPCAARATATGRCYHHPLAA